MADEKEKTPESPLEKKLQRGVTYCCLALAGAAIGFGFGVGYGKWLAQPIYIIEQNLNDDKYTDLSIADRELERTRYLGVPGGEYRRMER